MSEEFPVHTKKEEELEQEEETHESDYSSFIEELRALLTTSLAKATFHGKLNTGDYDGSEERARAFQHIFTISTQDCGHPPSTHPSSSSTPESATPSASSPSIRFPEWQYLACSSDLSPNHICNAATFLGFTAQKEAIFRCEGHLSLSSLRQVQACFESRSGSLVSYPTI